MKVFFVLAALLLAFQVKAQGIEPAKWETTIQNWQLDTLSPFYYDEISKMTLGVDLGRRTLTLKAKTDRGEKKLTAQIVRMTQNSCGAKVYRAFSESDNAEIKVTDFRQGICPHDKNKGQIQVETKYFERKSLHPSVDTFYAAPVRPKKSLQFPIDLITSDDIQQKIERRYRLQKPVQGL